MAKNSFAARVGISLIALSSFTMVLTCKKDKKDNTGLMLLLLALSQNISAKQVTISGKYINTSWIDVTSAAWTTSNNACGGTLATAIGAGDPTDAPTGKLIPRRTDYASSGLIDGTKIATIKGSKDSNVDCSNIGTFSAGFVTTTDPDGKTITGTISTLAQSGGEWTVPAQDGAYAVAIKKQSDGTYTGTVTVTGGSFSIANLTVDVNDLTVETVSGHISSSRTLGAASLLDGTVFVDSGATLTVPAGATVYGGGGSALIVLEGGKLVTQGTGENPVVFTSAASIGERRAGDWGGIVLIGKGFSTRGSAHNIEGDSTGSIMYGGVTGRSNTDSSGSLTYTRVEFAGNEIAPGDELNTFSLYTVGSGTTMNHLQALRGYDDSFESWGGAWNGKYLIMAGENDDGDDIDEGYSGKQQYVLLIKYPGNSVTPSGDPRGMEMDGASSSGTDDGTFHSQPDIANFTAIGYSAYGDSASTTASSNGAGLYGRESLGGQFTHGIIWGFAKAAVECKANSGSHQTDAKFENTLTGNSGANIAAGNCVQNTTALSSGSLPINAVYTNDNTAVDFTLTSSAKTDATSATCSGTTVRSAITTVTDGTYVVTDDTFFDDNNFCGGIDPNGADWTLGWTNWASK